MDYQGNSKKNKEAKPDNGPPEKNLESVVTGDVIVKKPGIGARFKGIFLGGDMKTASQFVVAEVLFPAVRNLVVDMINQGTDRLVYGEGGRRRRPTSYSGRIQYNNPIMRQDPARRAYLPDQRPVDRWARGGERNVDDIIVASKQDADTVVERLIDIVDVYEVASVADLFELLGLSSSHVDHKWGWTHLANIEVRQVREGYKISLPPIEEIA